MFGIQRSQTYHTRQHSSGRVVDPSQRPINATQNTHKTQTSMPSMGFEPAIPGSEEPQTRALDRTAIGIHVKLVARNLKVSQCRHICSCLLTNNISRATLITFLIYTHTKFHTTSPSDLLVIAMKLRDKENKRTTTATLLYHMIQKHFLYRNYKNWGSVVGRNSLWVGRRGVGNPRHKRFSLLHTPSDMPQGTHTVSCAMHTTSLSRVNRPRNGAGNQHVLTLRFSMVTATPLPLCIQSYVMG